MLQGAPHLKLETDLVQLRQFGVFVQGLGNAAYIVKRQVAKTVDFKHLALVDGVSPVDFKHLFDQGGNDVDFIAVIGDDACAEHIGNIFQRMVFEAFQLQLPCQALLRLDAGFKTRNEDVVLVEAVAQQIEDHGFHLLINGKFLVILAEEHLTMHIEFHHTLI